jgi:hypothetical protein
MTGVRATASNDEAMQMRPDKMSSSTRSANTTTTSTASSSIRTTTTTATTATTIAIPSYLLLLLFFFFYRLGEDGCVPLGHGVAVLGKVWSTGGVS